MMLDVRLLGRLGSAAAPLANAMLRWRPVRTVLARLGGIRADAPMPAFACGLLKGEASSASRGCHPPTKFGGASVKGPGSSKRHRLGVASDSSSLAEEDARRVSDLPREEAQRPGAVRRVAYFAGCFELFNEPEVARAAIRVLDALGAEVSIPDQRCCGIPKISAGDVRGALKDMRRNLSVLGPLAEAGWTITSGCPSCVLALTDDYPELAAAEAHDSAEAARARLVADHTRDIHALVADLVQNRDSHLFRDDTSSRGRSGDPPRGALAWRSKRLAYHAPCHLRAAGRGDLPRTLLEQVLGLKFVVTNAKCCGMGGTYGLKTRHAEVSDAIAKETFDRIFASGVEAVVTSCGMCRTQLAAGTGLPVYHPMELLAAAIEASDEVTK